MDSETHPAEKRTKKWIWGCTAGCLGLIAAVAAFVLIGIHVLMRAMPVVPAETFIVPQTTLFLSVRIEPNDPIMVHVPYRLLARTGLRQLVPVPGLQEPRLDPERSRRVVLDMAPIQMAAVLYPRSEGGGVDGGIAFSMYRGSRLVRLALRSHMQSIGQSGAALSNYKDARLASAKDGTTLAFRGNNFMSANGPELVRAWVDRLEGRSRAQPAAGAEEHALPPDLDPGLRALLEHLDRRQPILFAALNAHGEAAGLLGMLCPQEDVRKLLLDAGLASEQVTGAGAQVEPVNQVSAALTLFLQCAGASFASDLEADLRALAARLKDSLPVRDVEVQRQGNLVQVKALILDAADNLAALAGNVVAALEERASPGRAEPTPPLPSR
jgi:hypothetical protein